MVNTLLSITGAEDAMEKTESTFVDLDKWIDQLLTSWGMDSHLADMLDELMLFAALLVVAVGIHYLCKHMIVGGFRKIAKRTVNKWDDYLIRHKSIHRLSAVIPAIIVYVLLPYVFIHGHEIRILMQKLCSIYITVLVILAINGFLKASLDAYNQKEISKSKPVKGFMQVLQVIVFFIGGIIVISILINKSPTTLFAGLGASAAVLMLVFKDSILGFVAGIQLSANDMLRQGDWISVPSANANGTVEEITLNTVKIRNFDNTITTVPPYNLISNSFQNYRGMKESDGRRVSKTISLDLNTIHFCTEEMLEQIRKNIPLLADYKPKEGEKPTNSQLFRLYAQRYLRSLPEVNTDLDLVVTQEQTTEYGLPIKVYFFSRNKIWKDYETIQSDIFDHLICMVPKFDLKVYQYS